MEKYSVLMSVYVKDHPGHLAQSLESMINQTVRPDEIVLVEDGPLNNGLYNVIGDYEKNHPDLMTVVRLEKNGGLGNALNHGIKAARNELLARMDADDISLPHRCEMQLKTFRRMPGLSIAGTQMDEFTDSPECIVSSRIVPSTYKGILRFSKRRSPFNHPSVMYKKSAVLNAGGYAPHYKRTEDLELFLRMLQKGYRAVNLKKVYLLYRADQNNMSRRKSWASCSTYIKIMYRFYKKGYSSSLDMAYVVLGQLGMYLLPECIVKKLNGRFLRKQRR